MEPLPKEVYASYSRLVQYLVLAISTTSSSRVVSEKLALAMRAMLLVQLPLLK